MPDAQYKSITLAKLTPFFLQSGVVAQRILYNYLSPANALHGWHLDILHGTGQVLALGMAFQQATNYHLQPPPVDNIEASILAKCMPYSRCGLPRTVLAALSSPNNSSAPPPTGAPSSKAASSG